MTNDIQLFHNDQFGDVRALSVEGEPWFVAKDLADALSYGNTGQLTRILNEDEKGMQILHTPGGDQQFSMVSESGFYHAVLQRRSSWIQDKAKRSNVEAFQRWVTHEVLPAIRRTGGYMASVLDETPEQTMARAVLIAQMTIERTNRALRRERERNAALLEHNAQLVPKAQFYDNLMDSDGLLSIRDAAKILKSYDDSMSEHRLRQLLREDGMLEKRSRKACAVAIERHYMRERTFAIQHSDGRTTFDHYGCLTPKGLDWCRQRYCRQATLT